MTFPSPPSVAVIGAGPAGLMAADVLAQGGAKVTIYDRMASPGRKFLLAGRGGLNLTHSEAFDAFITRYGAAADDLRAAITALPPTLLRDWSADLGQPTFVGSSGRVFPQAFKASPLLRAWLRRLAAQDVIFAGRHQWTGFDKDGGLRFTTPEGCVVRPVQASILALGGASWPQLGSDGNWVETMAADGIRICPLQPANCGFTVQWSEMFRAKFEGQPLKNIALRFGGQSLRGEAVITRTGLEGGGIYALSAVLREAVLQHGEAVLEISLRPDLTSAELKAKLAIPRGRQSLSTFLRKILNLSPAAIALMQEASRARGSTLSAMQNDEIAGFIAAVPVRVNGLAPIGRAISTAGGIAFSEIDANFMLLRRPGCFAAGEMLDWEAPTGGYLLQACFATGAAAGRGALAWLHHTAKTDVGIRP